MLKREHEIICRLINGRVRNSLECGETTPPKVLCQAVAFMHEFADRHHHVKEEDTPFPAMVWAGVPEHGGPIAVTKAAHDQARALVMALERAIDGYVVTFNRWCTATLEGLFQPGWPMYPFRSADIGSTGRHFRAGHVAGGKRKRLQEPT